MVACAACGQVNPEIARFCLACGAPIELTPGPVAEERKRVTVLFCDLVGFTAASDSADPEDVRARIRPYHARLRREVEGFGGTVEKFIGDAVMAVFGAPLTHEDDPERAVRAGLRVLEAIADLNEVGPELGLAVRVGVETGEAVVALSARPELGEGLDEVVFALGKWGRRFLNPMREDDAVNPAWFMVSCVRPSDRRPRQTSARTTISPSRSSAA